MKFINAKFFYKSNELIDESKYSYWWILMGELKTYGESLEMADKDVGISRDAWNELKGLSSSYSLDSSTSVSLNNAFICGIADTLAPVIKEGDENDKGTVKLTASGSNKSSIIPFTVGQDNSKVGHRADSLWLLALNNGFTDINDVQTKLFPFKMDGNANTATQKYVGAEYDISDSNNCIPLIGYSVDSADAVNSINYSGFTVGSSVVTLKGLLEA